MKITIGYGEDNDIVLKDKTISRYHAEIKIKDNKELWLLDLNSKNGVYVNNRRVNRFKIDEKDQIVLGGMLVTNASFFNKIKKLQNHKRTDFTEEYSVVLEDMEAYFKLKSKASSSSKWPMIIRIGLSIGFVALLILNENFIPDPNIRYALILGIGMIPILLNLFFNNKAQKQEKLDLLKLDYESKLRCPKCNVSLLNTTPVYLRARQRCINEKCNAKFRTA